MSDVVRRYLDRRADLQIRPLEGRIPNETKIAIVVPALDEERTLPLTLESLALNDASELSGALVIVVVNNREEANSRASAIDANTRTLEWLRNSASVPSLHLAHVDAASPGKELAPKEGVGTARKIGMDHAANILLESGNEESPIVCLDADTLVDANYLSSLRNHFERESSWGTVIDFAHPIDLGETGEKILQYELFLRYHVLGLDYARSPFAFHTIGSAMAVTAEAYAAAGGMNRKQAGEDFYFLQQLAKTGPVHFLNETTVHPSARTSWRVPFGTGRHMEDALSGFESTMNVYPPEGYVVLRYWLALVASNLQNSGEFLLDQAHSIHPELNRFLDLQNFAQQWTKISANAPSPIGLHAQFHRWFDGLKSLKLIHHLRDHGHPELNLWEAWESLANHRGITALPTKAVELRSNPKTRRQLLEGLREAMRAQNRIAGLGK